MPVGTSCALDGDCERDAGGVCLDAFEGFPDGYCSRACERAEDCPLGSRCSDVAGVGSYCLEECSGPSDCRPGYTCSEGGFFEFPTCQPG